MLVAVVTLGALLIPPGHLIEPAVPLLHASAQEVELSGDAVIVVLADGVDPLQAAQEMGVEPTHVYQDVFLRPRSTTRSPQGRSLASPRTAECRRKTRSSGTVSCVLACHVILVRRT